MNRTIRGTMLPWTELLGIQFYYKQDILRKKYPYNCFVMTMYQSLLVVLMSLPFCVLGLSTQIFDELTEVLLQGSKL